MTSDALLNFSEPWCPPTHSGRILLGEERWVTSCCVHLSPTPGSLTRTRAHTSELTPAGSRHMHARMLNMHAHLRPYACAADKVLKRSFGRDL